MAKLRRRTSFRSLRRSLVYAVYSFASGKELARAETPTADSLAIRVRLLFAGWSTSLALRTHSPR